MKPTAQLYPSFETVLSAQQRFFEQIIARYFKGEQQQDVFQDFCVHLHSLYFQKYSSNSHLFDSQAWLRTVLVNFCISQLRKEKTQKNSVWNQTTVVVNLVAEAPTLNEYELQALYEAALGCVSKKEALILKLKFEYKCTSKEIEQKLGVQHVDVLFARIKDKIRKKMGRINLEF